MISRSAGDSVTNLEVTAGQGWEEEGSENKNAHIDRPATHQSMTAKQSLPFHKGRDKQK
jgi:hypothetical protein